MNVSPALEVARAARPALSRLTAGQTLAVALPDNRLGWFSARLAVRSMVHKVLGTGNYKIDCRSEPGQVHVTYHARRKLADVSG